MKNTTPTDSLHLDVEQPAHGDRIKEVLKSPFFDVLMLFFLFVFSSLSVGSLLALFDYFLGISFFVGGVSNPLDLGTLLIALPLLGSFYLVLFTSNSFMTLGYKVRYEIKVLVSATVTGLLLASGVFEVIAHLPASPPPDWNLDFIQGTQELVEPTANSFFSILGGAVTESFTLPFLVLTAALTVTARLLLIAQDILGNSPIGQRDLVASRRNRVERLERRIRNVLSSSRLRAAIVDVPIYEEGSSNEWGLICRYWHSLAARFVTHLVLSAIVVALLPNGDPKYAILFPAALSFFLLPAVECLIINGIGVIALMSLVLGSTYYLVALLTCLVRKDYAQLVLLGMLPILIWAIGIQTHKFRGEVRIALPPDLNTGSDSGGGYLSLSDVQRAVSPHEPAVQRASVKQGIRTLISRVLLNRRFSNAIAIELDRLFRARSTNLRGLNTPPGDVAEECPNQAAKDKGQLHDDY